MRSSFLLRNHPRSDEFIRHVTNKFVTTWWRIFFVSGPLTTIRNHPRSDEFIRHVTNKFVTTWWRIFFVSGRRSLRPEGLLRESTTKKPTRIDFFHSFFVFFVSSWLIIILSGSR